MIKKGCFITFEGGEGAGKSTLIESVEAHLSKLGLTTLKTRAPGGTPLGKEIREWLLHEKERDLDMRAELLLFLADRAQHVREVIQPALEKGLVVLCDRFNDSTMAYQGVARGFPLETVSSFCLFASHALVPDVTFYLDLDPALGLQRREKANGRDRIESEELCFHQKIRKAFQEIAKKEPSRVSVLDASLSKEEVFTCAKEKLDAFFLAHR